MMIILMIILIMMILMMKLPSMRFYVISFILAFGKFTFTGAKIWKRSV